MKLNEAVKQVVTQFGDQTIVEVRLVNLLSDFLAFNDYPAIQHILRDFISQGYSKELLDCCHNKSGKDFLLDVDKITSAFIHDRRFKKDLSTYAIECLLYGLGKQDAVNEPFSNGYNPYASESSDILDTLNQQLADYKKQYIDYLDKLPILPNDIIHDAAGYFTAESLNALYGIELKIRIISEDLGINDTSWCQSLLKNKKNQLWKSKEDAVQKAIEKKKKEYEEQIDNLVVQYTKYVKDNEDLPANDGSSTLHFIADEIISLYKEINIDYSTSPSDNYWNLKEEDFTKRKLKAREQVVEKKKKEYQDTFDAIVKDYRDYVKKHQQIPQNDGYSKLSPLKEKLTSLCIKLGLSLSDDYFSIFDKKFSKEKEQAIAPLIKDLEHLYDEEIKDVISQYKSALFSSSKIPTEYGQEKLFHIEERMRSVYMKAGIQNPQIAFVQKALASLEVQKKTHIAQLVDKLKKQYLHVLQEGITIPSNFYFKRSGYFKRDTAELLNKHADNIKELSAAANINYDGFCETKRDEILLQYAVGKTEMRNQIIWKLCVPFTIATILTMFGANYASSTEEIAEFDNNMEKASALLNNGDASGAITAYMFARDSYDGSFRPSKYQGEADEKITEAFNSLTNECHSLIENRQIVKAQELIESIPAKLVESNSDISSGIATIKQEISAATNSGVEELINEISSNGGKLDEKGKDYLDQLLKLSPEDYWLNFLKSKEK